ncbi:MAG: hypothetical protein FRX49_01883 [Trebouxia sp. A1-2]|nr:MAG: hypothetical protein FRX49_01883 [Trebouxia sp. A1-2]
MAGLAAPSAALWQQSALEGQHAWPAESRANMQRETHRQREGRVYGTIHNCIPKPGRLTGNAKKPSNQSPHSCFWRASISLLMKLLGKPTTNSVATCMYGTMWFEPKNTQLAGSVASRAQVLLAMHSGNAMWP